MSELLVVSVPGVTLTGVSARLRVLLVPRLTGEGTTLDTSGMRHWATRLADAPPAQTLMQVRLRTATGVDLTPVDVALRHDAEPEVWDAFFHRVDVVPYASATYPKTTVTPTSVHAEQVTSAYAAATESVGDPIVVAGQLDALQFEAPPPEPDLTVRVPDAVDPDFHRVVALMRHHPRVLRALGLIVELDVPRAALDSCGGAGEVSVAWRTPPVSFDVVTSPATAFVVRDIGFLPAPAKELVDGVLVDGVVVDGMVNLARTTRRDVTNPSTGAVTTEAVRDWEVHTVDIDAAVARLSDAKVASQRARARTAGTDAPASESSEAMPALRSLGMQLVHRDRGDWFEGKRARAASNVGAAALPTLTADDLVLGYRLDVRHGGARWHSAMWRTASYAVDGHAIGGGVLSEEGHVPAAAGTKGTGDEVYADGVVVRWDGHRLALPRPTVGRGRPRAEVVHEGPYRFVAQHALDPDEPPGLPELRFGDDYQLRLRVVDLAGGGLDAGDVVGDTAASRLTTYTRHEPVLPPEMPPPVGLLTVVPDDTGHRRSRVDRDLLGPGGSLDRLVIRSDPVAGQTVADLADVYPANDTRMLLPPPAGFTVTEWDDLLSGTDADAARLARRALALPQASAEPQSGRHYTWVPDAAADSVSATVLPLSTRLDPTEPSLSDWDSAAWPDYQPKQVHIGAPDSATSLAPTINWSSDGASADVRLPAACRAVVEIASAITTPYFTRFAAVAWAPTNTTAHQAVITGRHPVVTPARRLEVVHAVRAPLSEPRGVLAASRQPGDTAAVIGDRNEPRLGIDRESTAQLDVAATWDEWTDAGAGQPLTTRITQAVRSFTVDLDAEVLPPLVHQFADTRHRAVTYQLAARSRFREYFDATDPESAFVREVELGPVHVPSTVRPAAPVVLAVTPAFRTSTDFEFPLPDTMGMGMGVVDPDDTDADGIPDVEDDDIGPPVVPYSPPRGPSTVATREGGILRVELAGPWFTTGEGEQLGVIVSPGPAADQLERDAGADGAIAAADNANANLVTRAYRDPLLPGPAPLQPTAATMTRTAGAPLVVRDTESGVPVCVVPFDVVRVDGRWFADIGFGGLADAPNLPLVQLRLVRFQRHSLPTLTTSSLVSTDLVAVLPRRQLRIEPVDYRQVVTLQGNGTGGPVELRLEAAPKGTGVDVLTSLDPAAPGWIVRERMSGAVNVPFAAFDVPNDGRDHRIVVREYDTFAPRSTPAPTAPLDQEHSRLTVFAAVVTVG